MFFFFKKQKEEKNLNKKPEEKKLDKKPEEKNLDKKLEEKNIINKNPEEKIDRSICYVKKIPVKIKREHRARGIQACQDHHNNRCKITKSNRLQEKYNIARMNLKKLHEEHIKRLRKKKKALEEEKKKITKQSKHSKSSNNMKTDNRKMTGNVNIYICSEATENAQVITSFSLLKIVFIRNILINCFIC